MPDVVIVGGGAAGLATAIFARRANPSLSVLLLEGAAKPGAKILVSGGARCNVTNAQVTEQDFHGGKRTIIRRILRAFPVEDTIAWFRDLGVSLHEEAHGKMFPDSNRARDVLNALLAESGAAGAELRPGVRVQKITRNGSAFELHTSCGTVAAAKVVMATGGQSLPKSGSDGVGFEFARALGHRIVPTTPSLVPLVVDEQVRFPSLSGVAQDVELSVWINGAVHERITGALLWTHFGVSGPSVLDASRHWLRGRLEGGDTRLTVNFAPGERFESMDAHWTRIAAERPRVSVVTALASAVPASVALALVDRLGLDGTTALAHFSRTDRRRLARALVEWPLAIAGSRGYTYAEATAGGVALDEVDPGSMASRCCPGLYFVGEILDVDGRIGGFNFQWAWSTARVAGRALGNSGQV